MTSIATGPYGQALAWALVHFVWQGSAIGLAALLCLRFARRSAAVRYRVGIIALGAMLAAPVATVVVLEPNPTCLSCVGQTFRSAGSAAPEGLADAPTASPVVPTGHAVGAAAVSESSLPTRLSPRALAALLALWGSGVILFAARLAGGWIVARRWTRRLVVPVAAEIQVITARLADRLGVGPVTRVYESAAAHVPMVVGWLSPVILLPAAAIGGLSLVQLEALLAHELAHVRRHDYLVNLLQAVVEALLFYHPAVWWVSREVREAREQCCDDLAVAVCGDRLVYASALTELATMMKPRLALAATDGSLAARVRRILGEPHQAHRSGFWAPAVLAVLLGAALVPAAAASRAPDDGVERAVDAVGGQPMQDSSADRARQEAAARLEQQKLEQELARQFEIKLVEERKAQTASATERAKREAAAVAERQKLGDKVQEYEIKLQEERQVQEVREQLQRETVQLRRQAQDLEDLARDLRKAELLRQSSGQQIDTGLVRPAGQTPGASEYDYGYGAAKLRVEQAQRQLELLHMQYTEAHPAVQALVAKLRGLEEQLIAIRAGSSAVRSNASAIPGGTISLLYGDASSPSSLPLVRINADGMVDDLGFSALLGPINLNGLPASQIVDALVKAVVSQPDRLVEGKRMIGITLVLQPGK